MESTYEPEITELEINGPEQPDSDAPAFIVLASADDAACTVDGECL